MSTEATAPLAHHDSLSYAIKLGKRFGLSKAEIKQNSLYITLFPITKKHGVYQELKKQHRITKLDGTKDRGSKFFVLCEDAIVALNPSLKYEELSKKQISVVVTHDGSTFIVPNWVVVSFYKLPQRGCCICS